MVTLACYYFPNYHLDPRNEAQHGPGWTEWELVRRAEPRFPGHRQPRLPLWGEEDESNPQVMAHKIAAAADHGLDAFIFDWYWYNDGPFLERGLERGFLGAANNDRLKFALMWANHDWVDIHPAKLHAPPGLLYPGAITPATWETMTDYVIERYFRHPSYWRIAGCPYFSIYELFRLVQSFGSLAATREALQRFRDKTRAAGSPGLHLNAVVWGVKILPGEQAVASPAELVSYLGFDSVTSYVWIHHVPLREFPATDYTQVMRQAAQQWGELAGQFPIPYYPNVTMGWDSSPRTVQSDRFVNAGYPFMPMLSDNPPQAFEEALLEARRYLDQQPAERRILTINAWNEWTEGSYLEPDTVYGLGYLQAIQQVFRA
jgi:hypothetical protein